MSERVDLSKATDEELFKQVIENMEKNSEDRLEFSISMEQYARLKEFLARRAKAKEIKEAVNQFKEPWDTL